MGSALSKEIGMMEAQLNRWKETAQEAVSLRKERRSLETSLERKVDSWCRSIIYISDYFFVNK